MVFAGILKLVMYIYSITHDDMAGNNPQTVASSFALGAVLTSVLAGGIAGTSVDIMLFPIDAIKTRLQATSDKVDFVKKTETVSKFRGLASSMSASFPCAATFWLSYEYSKYLLHSTAFINDSININV